MTELLIVTLAEIAGSVVLLAICLQAFFRPRYMVSIQKTTNSASQPEVVNIQANLPWWASGMRVWIELEKCAVAAVSRMVSVNEHILDETRKMQDQISKERPAMKSRFLRKLERRKKAHVARVMGIPIDQVTDEQIQQVVAETQNGGVPTA
jgi:hypothetical protein